MDLQIVEARAEDLAVVQNLVRYYIYDFSEYMGWDCPESGLFGGCDELPQYWGKAPDDPQFRWPEAWVGYPFILRVAGKLAGFALLRKLGDAAPPTFEVGEFFVLRKFRRQGVGKTVAQQLFDRFKGAWLVKQMEGNKPGQAFWRKTIGEYTGGDYEEFLEYDDRYGLRMIVQRFSNGE